MTNSNHNHNDPSSQSEQLHAYLEDRLAPEERAAFEKQLKNNKSLQAELELQEKIDASLKRSFIAPKPSIDFLAHLGAESPQPKVIPASSSAAGKNKNIKLAWAAIAASISLVVLSWNLTSSNNGSRYQKIAMQEVYEQSVESGFKPKWVCEDDHQFAKTFQERQGQALLLKPIPGGSMVGLSYLRGLSWDTTTMLAKVNGKPVLVFIDRLERDTHPKPPSRWSGLHLFRKELSGLVLYEVTPWDAPHVMGAFYPVSSLPASTSPEAGQEAVKGSAEAS